MPAKVHPIVPLVTPKELREIQKYHELGKKYWPRVDTKRYEEEEKRTDPEKWKYYLRHPYSRLIIAYLVVFCNFLSFAQDPVSHSNTPCVINYVGEIYTFLFVRWPRGSFVLVKLGCSGFAILLGCLIGKFVVHKWLFCHKLKLKIFSEDGQGSWMVMFLTSIMSLYIFHFAYNGFLMLEGTYMDRLHASRNLGMKNKTFMKASAMAVWLGDFLTAWMVTDMMLQALKYADWAKGLRAIWNKGLVRVYAFWFVALTMTVVVATGITTDFVTWDRLNYDFLATTEVSRAFLSSFILVLNLLIIMQDWEFPYFAGGMDVKLPGINSDAFSLNLPGGCGEVYIAGKWFNYGIIFLVMILDMNMWKNQIFYKPHLYGQYTDPDGHIYTVSDMQFIRYANRTMMTYEWRWSHVNPKTNKTYGLEDKYMISKYKGYSLGLKSIAFVPSLFAFCMFGYLVWLFGQGENPDEELVRRYRCDVRRERQLKKLRKKKKKSQKVKPKPVQEEQTRTNSGWLDECWDEAQHKARPSSPAVLFQPFNLDDGANVENENATDHATKTASGPKRGLKYWLRHPYFRILTSYLVVFCNFLIFAEDPVSHSHTDCIIDIIGNIYAFVFSRYPPHVRYVALKVFMFTAAVITGCVVGKFFVHKFVLCRALKLKLFSESGQGSWMVMFLTTLLSLYLFGHFYSEFLRVAAGPQYDRYLITHNMGIQNETFMKLAAMGTWLGDFITAWMVTDMMLQENQYPWWCKRLRVWWRRGANRVIAFWALAGGMTVVVATAVSTDYLNWDRISRDFMPTNELSRAFLASFILVMDLMIVVQDWEFPHFSGGMDVKLPGLNTGDISFHLPGGDIHITGKWFNYGIIFIVMILDLNMWKNQIFYKPFVYGQYVDNDGYIYTVADRDWLVNATTAMLSHAWRWNNTNPLTNRTYGADDHKMNSRYFGYSLSVKGIAFIPSLCMFVFFGYLTKRFSREEKIEQSASGNTDNQNDFSKSRLSLPSDECDTEGQTTQDPEENMFALTRRLQQGKPLDQVSLNNSAKDVRHSSGSLSFSVSEKAFPESRPRTVLSGRDDRHSPLLLASPESTDEVDRAAPPDDCATPPGGRLAEGDGTTVIKTAINNDTPPRPQEQNEARLSASAPMSNSNPDLLTAGALSFGELFRQDEVSESGSPSPAVGCNSQAKESRKHWKTVRSNLLTVRREHRE